METPMRSSSQEAGHRARVADSRTTAKPDTQATNFEYDDNEWDIGIGDLIIDLDADIEKTNEGVGAGTTMASNASPAGAGKTAAKMSIEHSATVDKGLKMKIKRTKPGTKTSEAKHEIVKSNEQNGNVEGVVDQKGSVKHPPAAPMTPNANSNNSNSNSKRGSSGHRRDKTRDKHASEKPNAKVTSSSNNAVTVSEVNGIVRVSAPQAGPQRTVFPASTGPGPPSTVPAGTSPGPPPSPAAATAQGSASKPEQAKVAATVLQMPTNLDERSSSPPPSKKIKTESKEVMDMCVGTSVGTITEPDCLGPCEPGTSVTLEGIVWHETEGGVLVVNVTWRGKTYVGTLLDCTRHDWAPPRFCDSPTSDLDTRTPKGRETRSSVHSKLRNGGVKGRRGATNGSAPSTAPSSPTPFVPPRPEPNNKRKTRVGEEDSPANIPGKKTKVVPPPTSNATCGSPPPSPVLLECPEPNCSKKYKHINGLKYHQSHAHGSADDEDTKDVTSMSENDESNIDAPSPATPVKSPDKSQDSPITIQKKENDLPIMLRGSGLLEVPSQPGTPRSTPPSPATPQSFQDLGPTTESPTVPLVESKNIVKPGVLHFNSSSEDFSVGVFSGSKPQVSGASSVSSSGTVSSVCNVTVSIPSEQAGVQTETTVQSFASQLQAQTTIPSQFTQPPTLLIPNPNTQNPPQIPSQLSPQAPQSPTQTAKITQFKVKPTAVLMPDDKKDRNNKPQNYKKKRGKSPAGSPHPPQSEQPIFGLEQTGRDEVQSPAYSDISDDSTPIIETDIGEKNKNPDKKTESGQQLSHIPQYGVYSFYGPQYVVQQQAQQDNKAKELEKSGDKPPEKEIKKEGNEYQQKVLQQHYYPYGYMPGYPYNTSYGSVPVVEDKIKEERISENPSPSEQHAVKTVTPISTPIQVPTPNKNKSEVSLKEKHQNENHQILKESIEMKNQMNPYVYSRQHHNNSAQREEDIRRFYVYSDRRKEQTTGVTEHKSNTPNKAPPPPSPNLKHKEVSKIEDKKDRETKQEGVKPTMETQGPPPPPTSQYAYIHPSYMQSPHYGALPFDPNHPMYRGIMVPGPYSSNPYMHPPIPRYHAPEDLSRAPPPSKALDMLQHHAQYYSSHKIHELQERAIKSPTPKTSVASSSPSSISVPSSTTQITIPSTSQPSNTTPTSGKQTPGDNGKEARSPPPQRHVHTHHHTHVGLGYPMYAGPYGAAVLASQQAAAVTVINPYPPK